MKGLFVMVKKEFWEWRYSLKKLAMISVVFLLLIVAYESEGSIFVAASSVGGVVVILTALGGITHITHESILAEKKSKTLEFLMATRLPTISIVIGKIIPGMIISMILSIIMSLILLKMNITVTEALSAALIINFLLFIFLAGGITFIASLLMPDEKIFSMASILVLLVILGLLKGLTMLQLPLQSIITIPVLIAMNIIALTIASKLLVKTKIYLKI